ncbi:hypothetical protein BT96DRAFT_834691 [Gymnopus androsaceus JB14]|uniref:CxC2-like cysteine cluster KDZ transposase-associated domain-containing protein n=1 Tax=Gymnopus androsaceus JB14 TaxID=1447944 RepID=A0A6A4GUS5_9AGAR|nr:hypothetical protein BT96DRAFT_834691 [Gymnopus androsaceus JB14]
MRAQLFPASVAEPETTFTFTVMREYDLQSLQGKIAAYNYFLSLCHLTDNVHMDQVNDPYQPFMLAARAWRYFKAQIRLGGIFNLNKQYLLHCPPEAMINYCPICPDPTTNMLGDWEKTPLHLRDGNFKLSQFHKNSGADDKSMFRGNSYFPPVQPYKEFLASTKKSAYVVKCGHIKVINQQHNQALQTVVPKKTVGVVSTACSHVFILAATDMYSAESQAHVDASYARAYTLYGYGDDVKLDSRDMIRHKHTYNAQCDLAPNSIEQLWIEFNQVGGYTRQMNDANREDTIIAHINNWNHKKFINSCESLICCLDLYFDCETNHR